MARFFALILAAVGGWFVYLAVQLGGSGVGLRTASLDLLASRHSPAAELRPPHSRREGVVYAQMGTLTRTASRYPPTSQVAAQPVFGSRSTRSALRITATSITS